MRRFISLLVVFSFCLLGAGPASSDGEDVAEYIRAHYTKFEYRIPMRDGTELYTLAFVPNDASDRKTFPMLLARSPYSVGPYGVDRYPQSFYLPEEMVREGYIFVEQDVRGRFMSDGEFVPNIFEAEEKDFVKATHRVFVSAEHPSVIRVGVLPGPAGVREFSERK